MKRLLFAVVVLLGVVLVVLALVRKHFSPGLGFLPALWTSARHPLASVAYAKAGFSAPKA